MRAEDKSFYFLATPSYYDIPFFQRAYVWNEDNWSELLDNLSSKSRNHFLGSIILKNELASAGSVARFSVIDGQQRLTTLSILLRACYDHIVKNKEKLGLDEDGIKTCQVKMESILFVPEGGIKQKLYVKINHSHLDKKAFESVIIGDLSAEERWEKYVNLPDEDNTSSIIKAYAFFREELNGFDSDTIDYLWELLTVDKIKFLVNIDLDVNDNEQAIFDTVNSAGVRLSSADTIKNLLYQKYVELLRVADPSNADEQAIKEYEDTWVDAFIADEKVNAYWEMQRQYGRMKRSNIETFLHAFAVVNGFFNPSEDNMADLPQKYRSYIGGMQIPELEKMLMEMHDYANVFKDYFTDGDENLEYNDYVGRIFNICNVLEVSTFYPYILQQLYAYEQSKAITEGEMKDNFKALEKYIVLNAICKGTTKNYNNECTQLVEKRKTPTEVYENCIYISEGEFVNGLRRMTTNKLPTLLLYWVELYQRSKENFDIKSLKYEYTLEHIMPQKWAQNWSSVPSYDIEKNIIEDADEIERTRSHAIYEIGNMTLLNSKLNTSISNGTFKDKVNGKNGRKGIKDLADLHLTKKVIKNDEWDERKIYDRTEELEQLIREIWDAKELPAEVSPKTKLIDGGRKEKRLKFWEKALPVIREKNGYESFTNANPKSSNVISGSFGIGGFSVDCVANYDKARVDFYMNKGEQAKNKEAYNILFLHKEEIESTLGVKLIWDRADNFKSSSVSYSLEGVSIANENDWGQMMIFLADWSNKIRKTMIPYLVEKFPQDTAGRKSPELLERLLKTAEILKEWAVKNEEVNVYLDKCNRTYTRFTTEKMSKILPAIRGSKSDWNCEEHYFYEINNRSGSEIRIQLSFNSKGLDEKSKTVCNMINDLVEMKQGKEDWIWWIAFKTSNYDLPEVLDKEVIFDNLDKALKEIHEFEDNLLEKLGIL